MRVLPLLFLLLPAIELVLLIQVGSEIGALPTLGLVILTAVIGLQVLRRQGLAALGRARKGLAPDSHPGEDAIMGVLWALAGLLLLVPGLVTDLAGLLLLPPWTRRLLARRLLRSGDFQAWSAGGFTVFHAGTRGQSGSWTGGNVVEGEVLREPPANDRLQAPGDEGQKS